MSKKHKKHHKGDKPALEDKPGIKLVLKVGTPDQGESTPPPVEDLHDGGDRRHKHKKKKKKHKHHRDDQERKEKRKSDKLDEMAMSDIDEEVSEPPTKRQAIEEPVDVVNTPSCGRSLRERKAVEDENTPLQRCLDMLHKIILRKDVNGFFAYPVTDNIAPSYSKIIQNPMDLSTMGDKIESNEYPTLLEYKADFKLMCDNCMTYNHPETIYYKEAEKMLKTGLRLMSKDKMIQMKRNTPFMALVSDHELGVDQELAQDGSIVPASAAAKTFQLKPKVKKPVMSKFEAFPDRLTPEQILAQAQDAAKDAAEQLTLRKPHTKFGFLRRREDGSTTLNLLNPENDGIVSDKERVVNLGTLIGKVQGGTGSIAGFKEDKRNKANPVNYLSYGPYSTYAPVYDSTQCNLSKEDSDLLLNAYGDDAGTQYAYSIRHFVGETGDYALRMVDNLLDIITGGDHSKALKVLQTVEESQKEPPEEIPIEENVTVKTEGDFEQEIKKEKEDVKTEDNIDFNSLRTLTDIGIDVSFVDSIEERLQKESEVQEKLDTTCGLLQDLQKTQYDRLGQQLPAHLAHVPGPDTKEQELAGKVTDELTDLVKQANPAEVVGQSSVRTAIGVTLGPEDDFETADESLMTTFAAADTTTEDAGSIDNLPQGPPPGSVDSAPASATLGEVMGSPSDGQFDFMEQGGSLELPELEGEGDKGSVSGET